MSFLVQAIRYVKPLLRARLQLAHLPFVKTFEQFDFGFQPALDYVGRVSEVDGLLAVRKLFRLDNALTREYPAWTTRTFFGKPTFYICLRLI
jgi:hypothetical protein